MDGFDRFLIRGLGKAERVLKLVIEPVIDELNAVPLHRSMGVGCGKAIAVANLAAQIGCFQKRGNQTTVMEV